MNEVSYLPLFIELFEYYLFDSKIVSGVCRTDNGSTTPDFYRIKYILEIRFACYIFIRLLTIIKKIIHFLLTNFNNTWQIHVIKVKLTFEICLS